MAVDNGIRLVACLGTNDLKDRYGTALIGYQDNIDDSRNYYPCHPSPPTPPPRFSVIAINLYPFGALFPFYWQTHTNICCLFRCSTSALQQATIELFTRIKLNFWRDRFETFPNKLYRFTALHFSTQSSHKSNSGRRASGFFFNQDGDLLRSEW